MEQKDYDEINQYVDKFSYEEVALADQNLTFLIDLISKYTPENSENVLYAYQFTIDMECMIHELQQIVLENSKRNQTFRKQLLPLYKLFFVSLNLSRMEIFYDICNVLLKKIPSNGRSSKEGPTKQMELAFFDDSF